MREVLPRARCRRYNRRLGFIMTALLNKIQNIGTHDGLDPFDIKRVRLLNSMSMLGLGACWVVLPWIFIQENFQGLWGNLCSQAAIGGVLWLQSRHHHRKAAIVMSATGLFGVPLQVAIFPDTWGVHFWLLPLTLLPQAIFFRKERILPAGLAWAMFIAFSVCVLHIGAKDAQDAPELAAQILAALTLMLIGGATRDSVHEAEREAMAQSKRANDIMHMTLPSKAVSMLKQGHSTPFELSHDECTVLMADIVGFSKLAKEIHPRELIQILDHIFNEYDGIAQELGLEKIKTIGDAYMIAAGAPDPYPGHEDAIAEMALRMVSITHELAVDFELPLDVRIGVHTGVAWGGVIGQTRIAYDIWGDTVNMSARMEQHGIPGSIQISNETAQRLSDRFITEERGTIEVKHLGEVKTHFLTGVRSAETEPASDRES